MTSIIKVNTIADIGNNTLLETNGSGTITTNNIGGQNTPAFLAYLSSNQTVSNNTFTKISCNTELVDTNGNYDTSNYRFTPTIAGTYFIYGVFQTSTDASALSFAVAAIYKNGVQKTENVIDFRAGTGGGTNSIFTSLITDFNGSSDYVEFFGRINSSTNHTFQGGGIPINYFGGYKLIGA